MKKLIATLCLTASTLSTAGISDHNWQLNRNSFVVEEQGEPIVFMAASSQSKDKLVLIEDLQFSEGTIEFEVQSSELNSSAHNYPGLVFNVQDKKHWEAVYFRYRVDAMEGIQYLKATRGVAPFNDYRGDEFFKSTEIMRFHKKWRQVKIEISNERIKVYLDGQAEPEFDQARIAGDTLTGQIGFYAFNTSNVTKYRNLKITPKDPA